MAKLKVTQIGSPIRRAPNQEKNLIGLGLNKLHRSREHTDTPEVRGMIAKVAHLVKVEELAGPIFKRDSESECKT